MTVTDHRDLFQSDHAAAHHLVDAGHNGIYLFLTLHHLNNNGKIKRKPQQFVAMKNTVGAKSGNTSQYRGPGKPFFFEKFNQDFEKWAMPDLVALAQEYPHQYLFAAESCHDGPFLFMIRLEKPCRMNSYPGKEKTDNDTRQDIGYGHKKITLLQ